MPSYKFEDQAKIMASLAVVHNFIAIHDPDDLQRSLDRLPEGTAHAYSDDEDLPEPMEPPRGSERSEAEKFRDEIAQQMWEDYQEVLQRRRSARHN